MAFMTPSCTCICSYLFSTIAIFHSALIALLVTCPKPIHEGPLDRGPVLGFKRNPTWLELACFFLPLTKWNTLRTAQLTRDHHRSQLQDASGLIQVDTFMLFVVIKLLTLGYLFRPFGCLNPAPLSQPSNREWQQWLFQAWMGPCSSTSKPLKWLRGHP